MTALRKFDYTPDHESFLVKLGTESDRQLSVLCPVLVGGLRDVAARTSSSRLFLSAQKSGAIVSVVTKLADMFGGFEFLPEQTQRKLAEASLFLKIAGSTLASRYLDGTLEPELHSGGQASVEFARAQVLAEASEQEPVAAESDADYQQSSVNAASDGIA